MKILHLLEYKLKDILGMVEEIKNQGFDCIQISPVQELKEDLNHEWWIYYQPRNFNIGNHSGTKEDLEELCSIAKSYDIKIIADVVLNHLGGRNDGSPLPHESISESLKSKKEYWKLPKEIEDENNRLDVITKCLKGLPSLNHRNKDIQSMIIKFLRELISCGVGGFRFDAAKHIALPSENCDFWPCVIDSVKSDVDILYGEVIFETDMKILDEYMQYFYILTNEQSLTRDNKVSFVESHDDYLTFKNTSDFSCDEINKKYLELRSKLKHILYYARPKCEGWKQQIIKDANNL